MRLFATKWFMRFGKPFKLKQVDPEVRWIQARTEAQAMRLRIQGMVLRLKSRRRSVFFG